MTTLCEYYCKDTFGLCPCPDCDSEQIEFDEVTVRNSIKNVKNYFSHYSADAETKLAIYDRLDKDEQNAMRNHELICNLAGKAAASVGGFPALIVELDAHYDRYLRGGEHSPFERKLVGILIDEVTRMLSRID